jgi:hypothetical protein
VLLNVGEQLLILLRRPRPLLQALLVAARRSPHRPDPSPRTHCTDEHSSLSARLVAFALPRTHSPRRASNHSLPRARRLSSPLPLNNPPGSGQLTAGILPPFWQQATVSDYYELSTAADASERLQRAEGAKARKRRADRWGVCCVALCSLALGASRSVCGINRGRKTPGVGRGAGGAMASACIEAGARYLLRAPRSRRAGGPGPAMSAACRGRAARQEGTPGISPRVARRGTVAANRDPPDQRASIKHSLPL